MSDGDERRKHSFVLSYLLHVVYVVCVMCYKWRAVRASCVVCSCVLQRQRLIQGVRRGKGGCKLKRLYIREGISGLL